MPVQVLPLVSVPLAYEPMLVVRVPETMVLTTLKYAVKPLVCFGFTPLEPDFTAIKISLVSPLSYADAIIELITEVAVDSPLIIT